MTTLISFIIVIATIWLTLENHIFIPSIIALAGTLIALLLWWNNNKTKPTFNEVLRKEGNEIHTKKW